MSRYQSKFESIEKLQFHPVPKRPFAVDRAVCTDRTTVMVGANGFLYTDAVTEHCYYSNTSGRHADVFRCCMKLRVLSPKLIAQHIAIEQERSRQNDRRWRASSLIDSVKCLGLHLTKDQTRVVEKALGHKIGKVDKV